MPCNSGPTREEVARMDELRLNLPACLCAVLSELERHGALDDVLDGIDYGEAGVTRRWLTEWWDEHKKADCARRHIEREAAARAKFRYDALAKLTTEERRALGI